MTRVILKGWSPWVISFQRALIQNEHGLRLSRDNLHPDANLCRHTSHSLPDFVYKIFWLLFQQGGGLDVLSERFPPQQATPPLMMEERPALYPQPYSSPSPTTNLPGPFQGMVRQKPSLGTMPVQVTPPRGTFSPNMGMQPRQTLNRPPAAPNQLRLQLQQRLQGQQQVSAVLCS